MPFLQRPILRGLPPTFPNNPLPQHIEPLYLNYYPLHASMLENFFFAHVPWSQLFLWQTRKIILTEQKLHPGI